MSVVKNKTIDTEEVFWSLVSENEDGLKVFDFNDCIFNCEINITEEEVFSISFFECNFLENFMLRSLVKGELGLSKSTFKMQANFNNSTFANRIFFEDTISEGCMYFPIESNTI